MADAVTVERVAALEKLVPEWESLAAHALEPNPFFEHWLLLPALRAFASKNDVRIVCVRRGGKLSALFPFQLASRYKGLPVNVLASWRHPHCLLGTPLVIRDRPQECLSDLFQWLRQERVASIVEFSYVPAGGRFHQALVDALNLGGHFTQVGDSYTRGLLCRDKDADGYINSALSAESRQKLRRAEKRLHEQGRVAHRVLQPGDDIQRWIDEFLQLEARGWKGRCGSALACTETNTRFANEAFTNAFKRGQLVMVGVDLDDRPIARYCGFVASEGSFAFKTAYDEEFRRFAPGLLAELDMIRAFHGLPEVQWMDSFTDRSNSTIDRLWKHRRIVQRLAVGLGARGELAILALPLLQWTKRRLSRLARRPPNGERPEKPRGRPLQSPEMKPAA